MPCRIDNRTTVGIIPSFDFKSEEELRRWVPENVSALICKTEEVDSREAVSMVSALNSPELLIGPTRALCNQGVDAIIYACTACSFMGGHCSERHLRQAMLREGATVALTTSGAAIEAFQALNALRIAIAHPYVTEVGAKLEQYIVAAGFQIQVLDSSPVRWTGFGLNKFAISFIARTDRMRI